MRLVQCDLPVLLTSSVLPTLANCSLVSPKDNGCGDTEYYLQYAIRSKVPFFGASA